MAAAAVAYPMMYETIWFDQPRVEKAETHYQEYLAQTKYGATNSPAAPSQQASSSNLVNEIARARQHIQSSLNTTSSGAATVDQTCRIEKLEKENEDLRKLIEGLTNRIKKLEIQMGNVGTGAKPAETKPEPAKPASDDDDDDDLFGSGDDDDEELERLEEERQKAEQEKRNQKKKDAPIGKSTIIFAVKGYDDQTNWDEVERQVRSIEHQGLSWKAAKLEPHVYGLKYLLINAIVVDDECGVDFIEEAITEFEDVQSVDIQAFNKL